MKTFLSSVLGVCAFVVLWWAFALPAHVSAQDTPPANGGSEAPAWSSSSWPCAEGDIVLNTNFPFLGRCISKSIDDDNTNLANVFPTLMWVLVRVLMTIILVSGVLLIIVWGLMIAGSGTKLTDLQKGKWLIIKVIIWLLLLGTSAMILNVINPNFFGTASQEGAWTSSTSSSDNAAPASLEPGGNSNSASTE